MLIHMRTTIRLNPDLLSQLKRLAAETHRTMTAIIEDAIREVLARRHSKKPRQPVRLPTFKGNGLRTGVDLNHSVSLLDIMDGL